MGIPVGMQYTSSVSGSIAKHVQCEQCSEEYVYLAERHASGEGSSALFLDNEGGKRRAEERAVAALQKALESAIEPVPCIGCGWLQADMVAEAKRRHHRWMLYVGGILLTVGVLFGIILGSIDKRDKPFSEMWGYIGAIIGAALVTGRIIKVSNYDPNNDEPEKERFRAAIDGKVTSKAEFDRIVSESREAEVDEEQSYDSEEAENSDNALDDLSRASEHSSRRRH